jgi:membrane protein YdbS with pleckstrin-like domain
MTRGYTPGGELGKPMLAAQELVRLDRRRHGIVLVRPFGRALLLAAAGTAAVAAGWPISLPGPFLILLGALVALRAVWRWERTHIVVTTEKLFVVHGTLRRHAAAVRLGRVGAVEVEQSLLGRLLGYGTLIAGDLEISYVSEPREVARLVA